MIPTLASSAFQGVYDVCGTVKYTLTTSPDSGDLFENFSFSSDNMANPTIEVHTTDPSVAAPFDRTYQLSISAEFDNYSTLPTY